MREQQRVRVNWRDTPIKLDWWDCTAGFYCMCGSPELLTTDDETDARSCEACGRVYRMVAYLEMLEPPPPPNPNSEMVIRPGETARDAALRICRADVNDGYAVPYYMQDLLTHILTEQAAHV